MEGLIPYALKASVLLLLFYTAYKLLLEGETFYMANRLFLLTGLLCCYVLPVISIERTVVVHSLNQSMAVAASGDGFVISKEKGIAWESLFSMVYLLVAGVLGLRVGLQLLSLRRTVKMGKVVSVRDGIRFVELPGHMAPFSFFGTICYSRSGYSDSEIAAILAHEKAHCAQWHSVDILLGQLTAVAFWFSPFSWVYLRSIRQNLEFLADQEATLRAGSVKTYGYVLLKASGQTDYLPVANQFYNSIIKKRIIMMQRTKSRKVKAFKMLLLLPLLAVFLWSFNTKAVYVQDSQGLEEFQEPVTIKIDKNTTDEELSQIKEDLKGKGIDFTYTVVHNEQKEIVNLSVAVSGGNSGGNSFTSVSDYSNDGKPIDPVTIIYNQPGELFFQGKAKEAASFTTDEKNIMTWSQVDGGDRDIIEITDDNGKEVIKRNGKIISREELDSTEASGDLFIYNGAVENDIEFNFSADTDVDVQQDNNYEVKLLRGDKKGALFMLGDTPDKDWQYYLNGKVVRPEVVEHLDHDTIKSVQFVKGSKAEKKYKVKGKKGVVLITTD